MRNVAFPLLDFEGLANPDREKTLLETSRLGLPTTALVLLGLRGFNGRNSLVAGLPEQVLEGDISSKARVRNI